MTITIAHSPDSDDAFMFYALAKGKIDTQGLEFKHVLEDIETLNQKAMAGTYEVSAISLHGYTKVASQYYILSHGGSVGDGYGPVVVSSKPLRVRQLKKKMIAVPGRMTTAFLTLKKLEPSFTYKVFPFDQILKVVKDGTVDAGLVIHEGQLSYEKEGLFKVVDLGEWWKKETKLPLPLGINVIRRDLDLTLAKKVSDLIQASIQYALDHRDEALDYAQDFARGLDREMMDKFVGMYVNHWTLDYGRPGRRAIKRILDGLLAPTDIVFLEEALRERDSTSQDVAEVQDSPPPATE